MATIEKAVGRRPAGYLAPALSHSDHTIDLFAEAGGLYTCDLFHDDQPTTVKTRSGRPFVSIPYSLELNDTIAYVCLLYTSPSPRDQRGSRMPSSA